MNNTQPVNPVNDLPVAQAKQRSCPMNQHSPCKADTCQLWIWTTARAGFGRCGLAGL